MPQLKKKSSESEELERWQIEQIEKGIVEADRGEFASDEEVEEVLKRWTRGRPTGNG